MQYPHLARSQTKSDGNHNLKRVIYDNHNEIDWANELCMKMKKAINNANI